MAGGNLRGPIRRPHQETQSLALCVCYLPLCLASVIWTCVWIDAALSEVVMSPTWLTRTASLSLAFHPRYVKSAMCPPQMATSRFLPLWKAPRKDPPRNVSVNGIVLYHRKTIAKCLGAKCGLMRQKTSVVLFVSLFVCLFVLFLSAFLIESIISFAQHSHCSCFSIRKIPCCGFPRSPGLTVNQLSRNYRENKV